MQSLDQAHSRSVEGDENVSWEQKWSRYVELPTDEVVAKLADPIMEARLAVEGTPRPIVLVIAAFPELFRAENRSIVKASDALLIDVDDSWTAAHPVEVQGWIGWRMRGANRYLRTGTPETLKSCRCDPQPQCDHDSEKRRLCRSSRTTPGQRGEYATGKHVRAHSPAQTARIHNCDGARPPAALGGLSVNII